MRVYTVYKKIYTRCLETKCCYVPFVLLLLLAVGQKMSVEFDCDNFRTVELLSVK